MTLASFLKWMEKEDLISISDIKKDDDIGFDTRFHIQKCMFIAQHLGLNHDYEFNLYLHGPYSPTLSEEYYDITVNDVKNSSDIELDFRKEDVLNIMKYSDDWLEVATTLIDIKNDNDIVDDVSLIERTSIVKHLYPDEYIRDVFNDLQSTSLGSVFSNIKQKI